MGLNKVAHLIHFSLLYLRSTAGDYAGDYANDIVCTDDQLSNSGTVLHTTRSIASTIHGSPSTSASRISSNRPLCPRPRFYFTSWQISVRVRSSPRGRLSHFLPPSLCLRCNLSVVSQSRRSFLPSSLAAHFAAFCSLYSLMPATLLSKVLAPVP